MDKQKQIEEMARIIAFDLCPNRHVHAKWGEEAQCYSDNNFAECTKIKNVVDKLYNAGYRKIPENAVVLTNENEIKQYEWSKMLDKMGVFEFADKVRNETAEKFAERAKEEAFVVFMGEPIIRASKIDEIAKEITEGKE